MRQTGRWTVSTAALSAAALRWVSTKVTAPAAGRSFHLAEAPSAPVVIVPGARVGHEGPAAHLRSRLDTAVALVHAGRVRAVLVSGNAAGRSGDEITAMIDHLVAHGVPREIVVADPYGLDTYDTCHRAAGIYGVRRALITTQAFHLPRAIALCRHAGIEVAGVIADHDVPLRTRTWDNLREVLLARPKAFVEMRFPRDPAVTGPPDDTLDRILGDGNRYSV